LSVSFSSINFFSFSQSNLLQSLPSGVNFINVLQAPLTRVDPESAKNAVKLSVFTISVSARAKAARRTLMKLTPDEEYKKEGRSEG